MKTKVKTPPPKPETVKRTVQIVECEHGWRLNEYGGAFASAGAALEFVKMSDRIKAKNNKNIVTVIEWLPTTRIGRAAVKTLVQGKRS